MSEWTLPAGSGSALNVMYRKTNYLGSSMLNRSAFLHFCTYRWRALSIRVEMAVVHSLWPNLSVTSWLVPSLVYERTPRLTLVVRSGPLIHLIVTWPPSPKITPFHPKPVMCHLCCDGTWCSLCQSHLPSRTIACWHAPLECWSVKAHLLTHS